MLRSTVRTAVAVVLAVAVGSAAAADQTILGKTFVAKDPSNTAKRKVTGTGKEPASPNNLVGNPTLNGGFINVSTFAAAGGTPSFQIFTLPQGTSAISGKPFWSGDAVRGFEYKDPKGENGAVKLAQIKKAASGVFTVKIVVLGKLGNVFVVPPNPGNGACFVLGITGGDTYSVDFRHDPEITNKGALLFKAKNPQLEGSCATTTTTTSTTLSSSSSTTTTTLYGSPSRAFVGGVLGLLD